MTISAFCLTPFALLLIVAWIGSLQRQSRAPDLGPLDAQRVWTTFPPGGEPTQMLRWTMDCAQQVEGSAAGMQQTVHLSGDHVTALDHYRTALVEDGWAIADPAEPVPMTMLGHVTSSYWSSVLGRSIALAMVRDGRGRMGETLHVPMPGGAVAVTVAAPVFHDPEGARLND